MALITVLSFGFTSCGNDDDDVEALPEGTEETEEE